MLLDMPLSSNLYLTTFKCVAPTLFFLLISDHPDFLSISLEFVYKLVLQAKFYIHLGFSESVSPPVEAKVEEHDVPESLNVSIPSPTLPSQRLFLSSIENCSEFEGRADEADVTGVRFFRRAARRLWWEKKQQRWSVFPDCDTCFLTVFAVAVIYCLMASPLFFF